MNSVQRRCADAITHAMQRIAAAELRREPFAHIFVEEVFPPDFFAEMRANLPEHSTYTALRETGRVGQGYSSERLVLMPTQASMSALPDDAHEFWKQLFMHLLTEDFARTVMTCFAAPIEERFTAERDAARELYVTWESFLIRDRATYALGPHTDSPKKLVSMLFYLAPDATHPELGTSFYQPLEAGFECSGGPHYSFEHFKRLGTMPYQPNTLLAFAKNKRCFHGVEPVAERLERDLLFFDLRNEAG